MSAVIRQMVYRKRAARTQAAANAAVYAQIVAAAKGQPGLVWRGEWKKDVEYAVGDAVFRKGSSYIAIDASLNKAPPGGTWDLLAEKGKDGKAGKDGADGRNGLVLGGGGGGGVDLNSLPVGDPSVEPTAVAVKQNGEWVQLSWADFITMIGSLPSNAVTVEGDVIRVNGEQVIVTV